MVDDNEHENHMNGDQFSEVMALLSQGPSDVVDEDPPPTLWASIVAELEESPEHYLDAGAEEGWHRPPEVSPELREAAVNRSAHPPPSHRQPSDAPVVVPLEPRRRRGFGAALGIGIAAALVLVALPIALAFRSLNSSEPDRVADLAALDGSDSSARVELVGRELSLDVEGLGQLDGAYHELWLLDFEGGELSGLVSLGQVNDDGTFTIADDIDLDEFSVVDISVEPDDGDPMHSGDSILQGELQ